MVPLYALAVAFSAVGQVLAGDDGETSFPEPLIFHNLTMDEFHAKRWENRQRALHLGKRVAYLREDQNDADQQALIELHLLTCRKVFGDTWRPVYGNCLSHQPHRYFISCGDTEGDAGWERRKQTTKDCREKDQICGLKGIYTYRGKPARLPWCIDILPINNKVIEISDDEDEWWTAGTPRYDGKKTLPTEVYSPGSWDTFWQLAGEASGGGGSSGGSGSSGRSGASFYYDGSKGSGPTFRAQSPKNVFSWCCMGCPSGQLTVETMGFKSEAWGFTVPAWLL